MYVPPKQRRRCLRVHYLRQRGTSLKQIAEQLDLSVATVRADLKLVENHWSSIAAAAADDLLLESLQLLQFRLRLALNDDLLAKIAVNLTPVEMLRAHEAHQQRLDNLAREIRRTVEQVHRRAEQRTDQTVLAEDDLQELEKTTPKSSQIAPSDPTISSPEREIVESQAAQEKTTEEPIPDPDPPELEALIAEAVEHFPQLRGQSPDQILTFLDQLTDPTHERDPIPPAKAAA